MIRVVSKQNRSIVRFAAFAGVMVLVSGLVLTLFNEAQAASIETAVPSVAQGPSSHLYAQIVIPDGQKVPIASVTATVETNPSGASTKSASDNPVVRARSLCATPITGCSTFASLTTMEGTAIRAITLEAIYVGTVADGYTVTSLGIPANGYFSNCPCTLTHDGGYGYSPAGGYGYGGIVPPPAGPENNGYGYGYAGEDLILRFRVLLDTTVLANGNYWFTFEAATGSAILDASGPLSSPATAFAISNDGGGSTGSTTPGPGTGTNGGLTVNAGAVSAPTGATAAYRATGVTQTAGNTITINTNSDFVGQVVFTPSADLGDATIDVVHFPPDSPPGTVGNIPQGLEVTGFVQVTISSGGTSHTVTIAVTVPPGQAEGKDVSKAVLIKWDEGSERWVPKGRVTLTQEADGSLSGTGTSDCCSNYAVAFDGDAPNVTLDVPSGTLSGSQTITAEASDNLQVAKVEFYVDGNLVGTDDSAPFTHALNTASYSNGDHTIRAVAYDSVDNTAESSTTSSFQNEGTSGDPGGNEGSDGGDGGLPWGTILIILVVLAIIGGAGYYFYSQSQKK